MFSIFCFGSLSSVASQSFNLINKVSRPNTEKYPRGRRGSPAKGVVCDKRSEGSNPSFSAKKERTFVYQMRVRFFHLYSTFSGKLRQNQGKLGAAAVNGTVAALFLCPQQRQNRLYFLSFFAQIKNSKNIAS